MVKFRIITPLNPYIFSQIPFVHVFTSSFSETADAEITASRACLCHSLTQRHAEHARFIFKSTFAAYYLKILLVNIAI